MARELHQYDGYLGESNFKKRDNYSTYYDSSADKQSTIPIRNISEVKEELKQKYGEN